MNKVEEKKQKINILMLDDNQKKKLEIISNEVIDILQNKCNSLEENAFCLRILIESFEESFECVVPFKNRYTEPVWNYEKKGTE